jgi:hypothetical protein
MGRMNEMLGAAAAYSRGVAVQFGLEEQEGAPTVAPEIIPTIDLHSRPEQWALHGGTLLWGRCTPAAVAGNQAGAQLIPGTGELMIVEGIQFVASNLAAAINIAVGSGTIFPDSTGNLVSRDSRRVMTPGFSGASGSRILQQHSAAGFGSASIISRVIIASNSQSFFFPLDLVLVFPHSLMIWEQATNQAMENHVFFCRVRPGTPRELSIGNL